MSRNDKIAAIILGAAAVAAIIHYVSMPEEEKKKCVNHIKDRTRELLNNAEETAEKVQNFLGEYDKQPANGWIDKLYILKKMFNSLYK